MEGGVEVENKFGAFLVSCTFGGTMTASPLTSQKVASSFPEKIYEFSRSVDVPALYYLDLL